VAGGVRASTIKRYSTVFDKFIAFAMTIHILVWNNVTSSVLTSYAAHLEAKDYKSKTLRNELTTLGQALRWLIAERHVTGIDPPKLKLKRVESERAYCYEPAEVTAMIKHCRSRQDLIWLADVIIGLACTGLRISELAALRWTDVEFDREMITLTDESGYRADHSRQLKSGRSRSLPIHSDLMAALKAMSRSGTLVYRGPRGGKLKPDTVRNILIRDVIKPLSGQFPGRTGKKSFIDGRLHSFRHYFASACANQGIAERIVMDWLGHADSAMVRHYYHLHDQESRQQMARLDLINTAGKRSPGLEHEAANT
jgi:integrase